MLLPDYYEEGYYNFSFANYTALWIWRGDVEIAWKAALLSVIVLLAIISNLIIVFLIIRHKTLHKSYYIFVANLSIASILLNVYSPWAFFIDHVNQFYRLGELGCHLSSSYLIMFMLATGFSIVVISCDRLMIILLPFYKTGIQSWASVVMIIVTWLAAIGISTPVFIWKNYKRYHYNDWLSESCANSPEVTDTQYYLFLVVFAIYLPIAITAVTYIIILRKLNRYDMKLESGQPKIINRKNQVMKMFFMVMMVYFLSGLPFNILVLYQNQAIRRHGYRLPPYVSRYLVYFSHLLIYGHSTINPFIYGVNNEHMRKAFYMSFPCCRRKTKVYPSFVKKAAIRQKIQPRLSAPPIIENHGRNNKRVTIKIPKSDKRVESLGFA